MAARKPDYAMKCKIWFPQYTTEANGSIEHCVVQAFGGLPAAKRGALLNRLAEIHSAESVREIEKQVAEEARRGHGIRIEP